MRNCLFTAVIFLFGIGAQGQTCTKHQSKINAYISKEYPTMREMKESDLFKDAQSLYKDLKSKDGPGCVCEKLDGKKVSCAVQLIGKDKTKKLKPHLIVVNIEETPVTGSSISEFSWYEGGLMDTVLSLHKKDKIENRGEGSEFVQMPNDGIQLDAEGKFSFVFWFEDKKIKEIWTAD